MPLLFTSLIAGAGGGAPAGPSDPPFTWTDSLLYRFCAGDGALRDADGTPAGDGDGVAVWRNLGAGEDAVQIDPARRPTLRTGGLNGRACLACDAALQQHFADLAFSQPSGTTTLRPFTVFAVTDAVGALETFPALLGSPASNGGKAALYFRAPAGAQIHLAKSEVRVGHVTNPQLLMAAAGRSAAGTTQDPRRRFWIRQNLVPLHDAEDAATTLVSTAIAATELLRSTGTSTGGHFHGHLYELLLYDGTLDDATTHAVEDWLLARYGRDAIVTLARGELAALRAGCVLRITHPRVTALRAGVLLRQETP